MCLAREQKGLDIDEDKDVETWVIRVNTKLGLRVYLTGKKTLVLPSKIEMFILIRFAEQCHDYGCQIPKTVSIVQQSGLVTILFCGKIISGKNEEHKTGMSEGWAEQPGGLAYQCLLSLHSRGFLSSPFCLFSPA